MQDNLQEVLSEIPDDIADALIQHSNTTWTQSAVHAEKRQDAIAAANHADKPKAVDGIGYLDMQVDAQIYHWWNHQLPGCWRDKEFRTWFKKNFPTTVVKSGGTGKTSILMPGFLNRAA